MFLNLIYNSNKSHIISKTCNYGEISKSIMTLRKVISLTDVICVKKSRSSVHL